MAVARSARWISTGPYVLCIRHKKAIIAPVLIAIPCTIVSRAALIAVKHFNELYRRCYRGICFNFHQFARSFLRCYRIINVVSGPYKLPLGFIAMATTRDVSNWCTGDKQPFLPYMQLVPGPSFIPSGSPSRVQTPHRMVFPARHTSPNWSPAIPVASAKATCGGNQPRSARRIYANPFLVI